MHDHLWSERGWRESQRGWRGVRGSQMCTKQMDDTGPASQSFTAGLGTECGEVTEVYKGIFLVCVRCGNRGGRG